MAARPDVRLPQRQRLAGRDAEHQLDQVEPGRRLRDRVLDLDARVHLHEVELLVRVDQELHRPGALVADRLGPGHRRLAHPPPQVVADVGGGRLLDQLLLPPLDRAVALAEVDGVAVAVAHHLDLHVARVADELLQVDAVVLEDRLRGAPHLLQRLGKRRTIRDDLHPAPAAARRGLDQDGQVGCRHVRRIELAQHRHARVVHQPLGLDLAAHRVDGARGRPDPGQSRVADGSCEAGVLRQEAVAGVDRLGAGHHAGVDDRRDVQVAARCGRRPDQHRLVGQLHRARVGVGLGVDLHRLDAHVAAGADDPQRDLAPVTAQHFLEHGALHCGLRIADCGLRASWRC